MGNWTNYFISTAGVAAGLSGLIFVGLSINVKKIFCISKAHLPSRALGSLLILTNIIMVSNLCLVPGQAMYYLGIEILILGGIIWIVITRLDLIMYRAVEGHLRSQYFKNIFYSQFTIFPFILAGSFMLAGFSAGLYILVPGIIFSLIKALADIWYLIVDLNK